MANSGNQRNHRGRHRPHHDLFVEPPEILQTAATARHDDQVRAQAARGEHDENVVGIRFGAGHQPPRPLDARLPEHALHRGIALHGERAGFLYGGHFLGLRLDDDEGQLLALQFRHDVSPDATVAADDEMLGEFSEHAASFLRDPRAAQLPGEDDLRDLRERVCRQHTATGDQPHRENPPGRGHRMHLRVADRAQRDHRHVKRIEHRPALDPAIARDPNGRQHQQAGDDRHETVEQARPGRAIHGSEECSCFIGTWTGRSRRGAHISTMRVTPMAPAFRLRPSSRTAGAGARARRLRGRRRGRCGIRRPSRWLRRDRRASAGRARCAGLPRA